MCTAPRAANTALRVRDLGVRLLPELFAVDISYLSSLDVCLSEQLVERIDDDIRDSLRGALWPVPSSPESLIRTRGR
jgi:hypothetical protein